VAQYIDVVLVRCLVVVGGVCWVVVVDAGAADTDTNSFY
jgi:hypothetical protein